MLEEGYRFMWNLKLLVLILILIFSLTKIKDAKLRVKTKSWNLINLGENKFMADQAWKRSALVQASPKIWLSSRQGYPINYNSIELRKFLEHITHFLRWAITGAIHSWYKLPYNFYTFYELFLEKIGLNRVQRNR